MNDNDDILSPEERSEKRWSRIQLLREKKINGLSRESSIKDLRNNIKSKERKCSLSFWIFLINGFLLCFSIIVIVLYIAENKLLIIFIFINILGTLILFFIGKNIKESIYELINIIEHRYHCTKNNDTSFENKRHKKVRLKSLESDQLNDCTDKLKNTFFTLSKFVDSDIIRKASVQPQEINQVDFEKKDMIIMFSDIENFTKLSEELDSDVFVVFLEDYFDEMCNIILKMHGTIDKIMGDGMMITWKYTPDNIKHAVHTAIQSCHKLNLLNEEWEEDDIPEIRMRIGINCGLCYVGTIGCKARLYYTAIGDAVNLASRLESLNKYYGSDILISQNVYDSIKINDNDNDFSIYWLDNVIVKGRKNTENIYGVIDQPKSDMSFHQMRLYNFHENLKGIFLEKDDKYKHYQNDVEMVITMIEELSLELPIYKLTEKYIDRLKKTKGINFIPYQHDKLY